MSNGNQGAATAAPAVTGGDELARADQWEADALDAIDRVTDPADAERLLAEVATTADAMRRLGKAGDRERPLGGRCKLRAEARCGELLAHREPLPADRRCHRSDTSHAERKTPQGPPGCERPTRRLRRLHRERSQPYA